MANLPTREEGRAMLDRLWKRLDDPNDLLAQDIVKGLAPATRAQFLLLQATILLRDAEPSDRGWALQRDKWLRIVRMFTRKQDGDGTPDSSGVH